MDLITLGNYFFAEWLREKNKTEKDVLVKINSSIDLIFAIDTMIDKIHSNCGHENLRIQLTAKHFPLISYYVYENYICPKRNSNLRSNELPLTYKGIPIYFHNGSCDGSDLLHVFVNNDDTSSNPYYLYSDGVNVRELGIIYPHKAEWRKIVK